MKSALMLFIHTVTQHAKYMYIIHMYYLKAANITVTYILKVKNIPWCIYMDLILIHHLSFMNH